MEIESILVIGAFLLFIWLLWKRLKQWFYEGYYEKDKLKKYQQSKIKTNAKKIPTVNNLVNESNSNYNSINQNLLNKIKGDAFEQYIVELFNSSTGRFRLLHWSSDKMASNGMYAESNHNPDLEFVFHGDYKDFNFAIECKWRKDFFNGGVKWAERYQIDNYLTYENRKRITVYVAIGVGGSPEQPERLFLVPLQEIHTYPNVFESYLRNFERNPNHKFFYNQKDKILL